jgi:hypothetical protein
MSDDNDAYANDQNNQDNQNDLNVGDDDLDATHTWEPATIVGTDEEAALVAGFLSNNGIPTQVESLHASEFPADFGRLGEVHVMVPAERLDEARQLLAQNEAEAERSRPAEGAEGE